MDWAYSFIQLNEALSHVPLLSKGHISTMMADVPSADACGWLHQLQIHKLLQHKNMVVLPGRFEWQVRSLIVYFPGAPLWDAATLANAPMNHS